MEKKEIGKCVQCGNSILLDSNMSKDFNSYCYDCLLDIDLKDLKRDFNDLTDFTEGQIFTNDCAKINRSGAHPKGVTKDKYDDNADDDEKNEKAKKRKKNQKVMTNESEDTKEKWLQEASKKMEEKGTKGSFTEYCGGEVTEACIAKAKKSGDKGLVKKAVFAENVKGIAKKKKKKKEDMIEDARMKFKCPVCGKMHYVDSVIGRAHMAKKVKKTQKKEPTKKQPNNKEKYYQKEDEKRRKEREQKQKDKLKYYREEDEKRRQERAKKFEAAKKFSLKKKKKDMEIDIDDKRPPKEWWNACQRRIKQSNPNYSQEQVNKTCGMIYHKRGVRKVMDMEDIDETRKRDLEVQHDKVELVKFKTIVKNSKKEQPLRIF